MEEYLLQHGKRAMWSRSKPDTVLHGIPTSLDAHHIICGACGKRSVQGRYKRYCKVVKLQDLPKCMHLSSTQLVNYQSLKSESPLFLPTNDSGTMKPFEIYKIISAYTSTALDKVFHLHPESVHILKNVVVICGQEHETLEEATILCPQCTGWYDAASKFPDRPHEPPVNSIASGLDFGSIRRLPGIETPSLSELQMLSKLHHFHHVVKVHGNHLSGSRSDFTKNELRSHAILFRHDAPVVSSLALIMDKVIHGGDTIELQELFTTTLTVQLVTHQGEMENILHKARRQTHIQSRPYVFYQWLSILQRMHPLYKDDPQLPQANAGSFVQLFRQFCSDITK